MKRVAPALLLALTVLLAAAPGVCLAGARVRPKPRKLPTGLKPPKGYVKCHKCGNYHKADMVCCCPICGGTHLKKIDGKVMKCRAEKKAPRRDALCPVCRKAFSGPMPFNRNSKGGVDRDFCRHSLGGNVVESVVWMCPRCGYAHFSPMALPGGKETPGEFNTKVDKDLARAVLGRVKPVVRKLLREEVLRISPKLLGMLGEMDQVDIPDWIKYEAALATAELRKAPADQRAKLALEGAYACRREIVKAIDLPMLSRIIIACENVVRNRGGAELAPRTVIAVTVDLLRDSAKANPRKNKFVKLSSAEKFYLYLRLAGCWDRVGETAVASDALDEADKMLKEIKAGPASLKPLTELIERRRKLLKKEGEFRAKALSAMRHALVTDNAYPGKTVVPTVYLLGELYRRDSQYGKARPWMTLGALIAGPRHPLSKLVAEAAKLPNMKRARIDVKEEAAAIAWVARVTGKNPEELMTKDPTPATGAGTVTAKPKNCAECLANIHKAYAAYVAKHKKAPPDLARLAKEGFISIGGANGFRCPDCNRALSYRRPKRLNSADELMVWHPRSRKCKRLLLYSDGKIKERK